MTHVIIKKSTNPKKKYIAIVESDTRKKTLNIGAAGMSDYTLHHDDARKQRYINRHKANENFNDPFTAGFWALHILWNKKTIESSMRDTARRYGLHISKR